MKKLLVIAALFIAATSFAADPNQKVLNAFQKTFQNVKEVTWNDVGDKYEANFNHNNIITRVLYDGEGNVVKSIRYYYGNTLPIFIQAKLNKKFEDKTVFGVTEVCSDTEISYHIILEDATTWTHVQSDVYGNLVTEKKLKKA